MRNAQRALQDEPWIRLWAELAVLAHLSGWPTPIPQPHVLATLEAFPARTIQCAISRAADSAIAASPGIPHPQALGAHASAAILARAERAEWLCRQDEPEWLLPDAATMKVAEALFRPTAGNRTDALPDLLAKFIDCQWPLEFLPAN
jgi:hypothetical protein